MEWNIEKHFHYSPPRPLGASHDGSERGLPRRIWAVEGIASYA